MASRLDLHHHAARLARERPLVTRYAPSPTGYLHLGHVVHAIYVWGVARALGARVLVRVEDHDRIRSRPEYEHALIEDLRWLGFAPDEACGPIVRQSDREDVYRRALESLRARHHVYACACSRRDVGGERYDARCRDRNLPQTDRTPLRVEIAPGTESFDDLLEGPVCQEPAAQCGDLLLRDRDGHWTYQFTVTVDDMTQGINLIIRGADILASTGRQLRLARMLGRPDRPLFLHHPLIMTARGEKLSKSSGDTGVRNLRAAGVSAEETLGRAAAAAGLIESCRPIAARDLSTLFGT